MAGFGFEIDSVTESSTNTPLDIADGVSYFPMEYAAPAPDIKPIYASSIDTEGARLVASNYENRVVTYKVRVRSDSAVNLQDALKAIQRKVGKLQREGGFLSVTYPTGDYIAFDVLTANITDLPTDQAYLSQFRADVTLRFDCKPFARGPETVLTDFSETSLPCLIVTATGVAGDVPALGKLVVDEDQGVNQKYLRWGLQSRYYSSASSAALFYQAESLTPRAAGAATAIGPTGASGTGSNTILANALATTYQAVLSTLDVGGSTHMSHIGDFRVHARMQVPAANTGDVTVKLTWADGDFLRWTDNAETTLTDAATGATWRDVDLGLVHLPEVVQGTQRWEGRIAAKSTVDGDDLYIDCLYITPVTEGYAEVRAVDRATDAPPSYSGQDGFDHAAGSLAAKTATAGGVWAGVGDTDDFATSGASTVTRATTSDTAPRVETLGSSTLTDTVVGTVLSQSATNVNVASGVVARYVDSSNYLWAGVEQTGAGSQTLVVKTVIGGTPATLQAAALYRTVGGYTTLTLSVTAAGYITVTASGDEGSGTYAATSAQCATGGTLASGKFGLYDYHSSTGASTRTWQSFYAYAPLVDAAVFASQSLTIYHDKVRREDSGGTLWVKPSKYEGSYLTIPPAGQEGRTTRIVVKASRNDPDLGADSGVDDISARLTVTPRFLVVPEA